MANTSPAFDPEPIEADAMNLRGSLFSGKDPDEGKIDYGQIIHHECGHATCAIAKGKTIKSVRIGRWSYTDTHGEQDHEPKDDPRVECTIAAAAVVAERIFSGRAPLEGGGDLDHDNIRYWVREYPSQFPDFQDTEEWFGQLTTTLEAEAEQLLREHKAIYDALVSELQAMYEANGQKGNPPIILTPGKARKIVEAITTS